ncbi:MAG: hypothetical protein HUU35_07465, partial [Armatimonadetes bacterium]|nr:hypothetical protein [Armatimonadota bacterium]
FVSWYEEDSGWVYAGRDWSGPTDYRYVSDDGSAVIAARLEQVAASQQRVAVEPYTTFDVELSVAYDRRLSIAEKLVDFGKVVHGGISQWVPVTLINEGNVPLRDVRFWVEKPLRPIDTEDRVSDARMAQMQPVPAWFLQNLALGFGNEDSPAQSSGVVGTNDDGVLGTADDDDIGPAPVGSPQGRTVSEVYLRVGRLDPSDPTQDRRVPIGQPFGNYSGQIRVFVDNLGLADDTDVATDTGANADRPDAAETVFGGSATMKLTVQESPLWRIDDFYDNDTSRRSRLSSGGINNLEPYNANTGVGTYQPIPAFKRWDSSLTPASDGIYSDPDAADTTPAIAVVQDPAEFTATPPNVNDRLWVGWSSLRSLTGGVNWGVYFRDATRPTFSSGNILQTNYRSFRWPTDGSGGAGLASNSNGGNERNLYPNVCLMPGSTGADPEYLLLWHSEQEASASARRASYLQFKRYQSGTFTNTLQIPDDVSGGSASSTLNKQVPRAFVNRVDSTDVLWVAWQTGESGQTRLGFNAIAMPAFSGSDDGTGYVDAIGAQGRTFNNYALRTPPGLLNVMEPYVLPSARHEATNMPSAAGALRAVNVLYSGWSPLWRNQDIYWSRYRPIEDETLSSTDPIATRADGLRYSPMAEDAYRLGRLTPTPALGFPTYYVRSLPGGRLPFPRITNELLQTNSNHTVYAASAIDWVMPPDQPRVSGETSTGGWSVERLAHRGFADTDRPLFDSDRYATLAAGTRNADLDPLVVLRVYRAGSLNGQPISSAAAANSANAGRVDFDLEQAYWDESEGEWVLPIATQSDVGGAVEGSNLLLNLGVSVVRVHPGLGRVTFNKPLYRRGATNPVYVYASFRPCAWRITTDPAVDAQPTAAFDWWERMAIVWRRSDEGGQGQLWYRTFSLAVPLAKAPVTRLEAVVNNADADPAEATKSYDGTVPGSSNPDYARIGQWSFVGRNGGRLQAGDGAWSRIAVASTTQGFALTAFDSRVAVTTDAAQGDTLTGQLAAGMVHFGFDDIGRTVRVWYRSPADLDTSGAERLQEEAFRVPGLGPERLVPIDGAVNESQPAIAAEHSLVGYQLSGATERIMSSRYWLAWVSTRDLFVPDATDPAANPPRLGRAGTNIFYGAFMPEFSPATVAR